jgi:ferritin
MINKLYNLAQKVGDNAAAICLQWFVTEQIEEEKSATEIIEMLKMIKGDSGQMILIDRELANRPQPQPAA